jgi:four helix bundle protein
MNKVNSFDELEVYQAAFALQQDLFGLSKRWPKQEDYSLTDQIRRSSRSIGANIAESWSKRRYPAHFLSKHTDSDGELQETLHRLKTAKACEYVSETDHQRLLQQLQQIGRLLGGMINRHESFCF